VLLYSAVEACRAFKGGKGNAWLDTIGLNLPVVPLPLSSAAADGGLVGAVDAGEAGKPTFRAMAQQLARDGWVAMGLFGPSVDGSDLWRRVCAEGEALVQHMAPHPPWDPLSLTSPGP
jgi:hypothetical protein